MKKIFISPKAPCGFTIMEILVAVVLIAISATSLMYMQNRTWFRTRSSGKIFEAGHIVEQQIELLRMNIALDTAAYWPGENHDTSFTHDSYTVRRVISPAYSPKDSTKLSKVRQVKMTVSWGGTRDDTLVVTTCISKNF